MKFHKNPKQYIYQKYKGSGRFCQPGKHRKPRRKGVYRRKKGENSGQTRRRKLYV